MLMNAVVYAVQTEMVSDVFARLGYPTYLVYLLGTLKVLGVIAIVTRRSTLLKEWAYAGFFFNFVLAAAAHIVVDGGEAIPLLVAIVLLLVSRFYDPKVFGADRQADQRTAERADGQLNPNFS